MAPKRLWVGSVHEFVVFLDAFAGRLVADLVFVLVFGCKLAYVFGGAACHQKIKRTSINSSTHGKTASTNHNPEENLVRERAR